MKKTFLLLALTAALTFSSCGKAAPGGDTAPTATPAPTATAVPATGSDRQDGERFDTVIVMEGMEETVHYSHVRDDTLGFAMDYDYESFTRFIDPEREWFVSVYDDENAPENYLEVRPDTRSAELAAEEIGAALSEEYDILTDDHELERAGLCLRIEASAIKGTNRMAEQLQAVYIIPAADGCLVATAHYSLEGAEGFGRRFAYMLATLEVLDR